MPPTHTPHNWEPLTEPLTLTELAKWFGVSRDCMRDAIKSMKGVERLGRRYYQIPVRRMPVGYRIEKGLMPKIDECCREM